MLRGDFGFTQNFPLMLSVPLSGNLAKRMSPIFHTRKVDVMRASVNCRIRKDRANKAGEAPVFLQVIINSERCQIPLKISWPIAWFDNKSGEFLSKNKNDQEASDLNMLVQKEKTRINEIFMFYRHSDFELTITAFQKEYSRFGLRKNFITWSLQDVEDRYSDKKIEYQTYRNLKSQLHRVAGWKEEIKFSDLNEELLESLQAWLRKTEKLSVNSTWSILKTVKSMARRAEKAGIAINTDSISAFKMPSTQGKLVYCTPEELTRLWKYFRSEEILPSHFRVLQQFLFSTLTGLRFSDIERVTWKNIDGDLLDFEPWKTRNLAKRVIIPLSETAFSLIPTKRGNLFECVTGKNTNELLKAIAIICGIRKNLTTHVARHTFATEFLRQGGSIEVLQKLLGHSKIATTMIYAHVDISRIRAQISMLRAPALAYES
tara:strand:- start:41708 stop:43003 length:1296 start_codon:yes stop_codon:yes gene_type:complete